MAEDRAVVVTDDLSKDYLAGAAAVHALSPNPE